MQQLLDFERPIGVPLARPQSAVDDLPVGKVFGVHPQFAQPAGRGPGNAVDLSDPPGTAHIFAHIEALASHLAFIK